MNVSAVEQILAIAIDLACDRAVPLVSGIDVQFVDPGMDEDLL